MPPNNTEQQIQISLLCVSMSFEKIWQIFSVTSGTIIYTQFYETLGLIQSIQANLPDKYGKNIYLYSIRLVFSKLSQKSVNEAPLTWLQIPKSLMGT